MQNIRHFSGSFGHFRMAVPAVAIIAAALVLSGAAADDSAPLTPELAERLAAADAADGEKLYMRRCRACHTNDKDGANKTGPNLWNIVGRAQGAREGFRYSDGLKALDGHWGPAELDSFLTKPMDYVPGVRMAFPGLKKEGNRADLIAYLMQLSDRPQAPALN